MHAFKNHSNPNKFLTGPTHSFINLNCWKSSSGYHRSTYFSCLFKIPHKIAQLMPTGSCKRVYMNIVLTSGVLLKQDVYLTGIIIQFLTKKFYDNFKRNFVMLINIPVTLP